MVKLSFYLCKDINLVVFLILVLLLKDLSKTMVKDFELITMNLINCHLKLKGRPICLNNAASSSSLDSLYSILPALDT